MKPNFKDKRGTITDLLVTPKYSITHITFKKGAIRGNHLHKKTTQIDIILKGRLFCASGKSACMVDEKESIYHLPNTPHAYKALMDSEMVSICFGIRRGKDYSKDTYKLKVPLL